MDWPAALQQEGQSRADGGNWGCPRVPPSVNMMMRQARPSKVEGLAEYVCGTGQPGKKAGQGPELKESVAESPMCDFSWLFSQQCGSATPYQSWSWTQVSKVLAGRSPCRERLQIKTVTAWSGKSQSVGASRTLISLPYTFSKQSGGLCRTKYHDFKSDFHWINKYLKYS